MTIQLTEAEVLKTLAKGRIQEKGLLPYSSNHSFLVTVEGNDLTLPAVYKPQRGESPLWDFEWGTLCKRETAAYVISHALGWLVVPPTVLRQGTRGLGSVQFYVSHDSDAHYFTVQDDARYAKAFRQIALFDYVANNADRKSGHCLIGADGRVWAIDHGICFHVEYKLRTVVWEFSGQPIERAFLDDLSTLRAELDCQDGSLARQLATLLSQAERQALRARLEQLLRVRAYPSPVPQRRNYPWPPV